MAFNQVTTRVLEACPRVVQPSRDFHKRGAFEHIAGPCKEAASLAILVGMHRWYGEASCYASISRLVGSLQIVHIHLSRYVTQFVI